MTIKFKAVHTVNHYKVFDSATLIGYASKRSNGWIVAQTIEDLKFEIGIHGPFQTRKQAGSQLRKLSNG
jgi:hypothetical protein